MSGFSTTGTPARTSLRILGFGTYDTATHPRVGIVLDGLRAAGDDVCEANAPLGFTTAERVAMLGRPSSAHRLIRRLIARWWRIGRESTRLRRSGRFDAVVVGYLGHFDVVVARLLFPRTRVVLDLLIFAADTAQDRGVSPGVKVRLLGWLDALAIRCADTVMVDTDEHLHLLARRHQKKAVVVSVGAPGSWFEAGDLAPPSEPTGPLRVVFFGLFTPLQGTEVVGTALAELVDRPDVEATMIGSGQDSVRTRAAAAANERVSWTDWVSPNTLPAVVAAHDVCLGIFATNPKSQRVVPNKVYQGAAAGCAIVTSDTPPQRRILDGAALFVPPGDARALAGALRQLATDRAQLACLRGAARARSRTSFTPSAIVDPLRQALLMDPSTPLPRGTAP